MDTLGGEIRTGSDSWWRSISGGECAPGHAVARPERDEVQAVLLRHAIRNAATEDLDLFTVDVHLDACDMRRRWLLCVRELDTVGLRASDHPLLLLHGELVERHEIVDPAHRQHVAAALSGVARRNQRNVGPPAHGPVGGAINEAGDVPPAQVREAGLLGGEVSSVPYRQCSWVPTFRKDTDIIISGTRRLTRRRAREATDLNITRIHYWGHQRDRCDMCLIDLLLHFSASHRTLSLSPKGHGA